MEKKEQYNIDEAIKYFYDTEPLKRDLATTVANRVFAKKAKPSLEFEYGAYFILFVIIAVSIAYYFSLLIKLSMSPILILLMVAGCVAWMSMKEFSILSKKLLEID
ncbi:MAG TPA: hypothetical protein VF622_05670 [Segetibacter sp.]|jgi:hypothetical protein